MTSSDLRTSASSRSNTSYSSLLSNPATAQALCVGRIRQRKPNSVPAESFPRRRGDRRTRPRRGAESDGAPGRAANRPTAEIDGRADPAPGSGDVNDDAASSIANGIPSRRRQISTTAVASSASARLKLVETLCARATKRSTAGDVIPPLTFSEGTDHNCSSPTSSRSRLVARIRTLVDWARIASIRSAAASRTCSQLSNTSNRTRPSSAAATLSVTVFPGCCVMPNTAATASGTAAGSVTAANSKNQTPSGNSSHRRAATSVASRVLPTPPTPANVTNRWALSASRTWSTSDWRPTKLVNGGRRFPGLVSSARNAGKSVRSPGARIWNTPTGVGRSRNRRGPRSTRSTPLTSPAVDSASSI